MFYELLKYHFPMCKFIIGEKVNDELGWTKIKFKDDVIGYLKDDKWLYDLTTEPIIVKTVNDKQAIIDYIHDITKSMRDWD